MANNTSATTSASKPVIATPKATANPPQQGGAEPSTLMAGGGSMTSSGASYSPTGSNPMTQRSNITIATPQAVSNPPPTVEPPQGTAAVRAELVGRNVNNDRIGWNTDTGYVTIDGRDALKPSAVIDGTSYASRGDINRLTNDAYAAAGDSLVAARSYMDGLGIGSLVSWDGQSGTVNIGGHALKPTYISDDGIAYIPKSQLDSVAELINRRNGQTTPSGVLDAYLGRYDDRINTALDALTNRKSYSYDPDTDPVYQAYKQQYEREAEAAFRSMLNKNNSSIQSASGAVLSAAMAARDAELRKMTDMIPTLENSAYNRYMGETGRLRDNLGDIMAVGDNYYNKEYQRDRDSYDRTRQGMLDWQNEQQRIFENQETARLNDSSLAAQSEALRAQLINNAISQYRADRYPEELDLTLKGMDLENKGMQSQIRAQDLSNENALAYYLGGRINSSYAPITSAAAESLGYKLGPDGYYLKPDGTPYSMIDQELDYQSALEQLKYNAALGVFR